MDWLLRAGFEIVNDGFDLNYFYIARAPVVANKIDMIVPGKVAEGSVGELKSNYIPGRKSLIHLNYLSGGRAGLEAVRIR